MNAFARTVTAVVAPLLGLSALVVAAPASSATLAPLQAPAALATASLTAAPASLEVSPRSYIGGQQLTWTGDLGVAGKQPIHLQRNLNRPGDNWEDVEGSGRTTNADGSFSFTFLAPAMFNIKFRVVGGGQATPALLFNARSQDLTLAAPVQGAVGRSFPMVVDTAPTLYGRPDLPGPVLKGRKLTLQRLELNPASVKGYSSAWSTVQTTSTDAQGMGRFSVTPSSAGKVVYRVRQEGWTTDGSRIGWFPSFPTAVNVLPAGSRPSTELAPIEGVATAARTSTTAASALTNVVNGAGTNSASTFGWGNAIYAFDWAYGESLSSAPWRGTRLQGAWNDVTTGTGRVSIHNGAMALDSQRDNADGPGDVGTTRATLRGNALTYGRWEVRMRLKSTETNARDYRTKIQLIPDNPDAFKCGANTITIADIAAHSSGYRFGARSAASRQQWTGTKSGTRFIDQTHHFGVEVTRDHISWFLDGTVIGTVKNEGAVADVPMTIRVSMVGKGHQEMNRTEAISDWVRGFSPEPGVQKTNGASLDVSRYGGC